MHHKQVFWTPSYLLLSQEVHHSIPSCPVPCTSSPCQHSGSCQEVVMSIPDLNINIDDLGGYQCQCPPPFTGPNCQVRHNPCVWPVATGHCDLQLGRFFYDRVTQQCLPFNYTGLFSFIYKTRVIQYTHQKDRLCILILSGVCTCIRLLQ